MLLRETYVKLELPKHPWAPLTDGCHPKVINPFYTDHSPLHRHLRMFTFTLPTTKRLNGMFTAATTWASFWSQIFTSFPHVKNIQIFSQTYPDSYFYMIWDFIRSTCSACGSLELGKLSVPLPPMYTIDGEARTRWQQ